ncbi:MAG: tetratricopeptide repeat protein [Xanthomonadales bacterium]|nr:tetratricopeptide repeat protein [Xanthomonadales bacterium]NIN74668.1 tetratricopeptide repeat protein [Xanthomonadales bacterium]NIP11699.1 tetratricopeptide repeat protein [Xanthomonadales bacterium]NIP75523.1 tetratricopeptide repeat protein [Xanthomonadales bacterium]NIT07982.1 tetratricopeptide repeat protein [Xanthomonadales bacterium]
MTVLLTYLIQVLLVIHVFVTGRNRYWVLVLLFLPLLGGAAYLLMEVLPELRASVGGQRLRRRLRAVVQPGASLRTHALAWERSPNADNARRYAEALLDAGQAAAAEDILGQALTGLFSTEPNLLLLRARARFAAGRTGEAVEILESLRRENPEFKSPQAHLLYARALEAAGRSASAISEFRSLASYFPGAQARYRLARALHAAGEPGQAREELELLLNDARLAPAHYRKAQRQWLRRAAELLRSMA